ncbi:growth arrest and DNA damage-inducible proteins-interacting protein 1 [Nematolebias whitei]|uniref:growth arrest and DNA damage-inducible proteins-interacting protein 1 n=1 Tax=Nematolebias whitei TaxID=451745 RepID=UPI001897DECF|nr:growth arrest and DNA damage-inducible proteins-interacting protein 1 [Nematolebias whitei]
MALSMLSPRMVVVCRTFKGISSFTPILSVNCPGFVLQTATYNPKPLKINIKKPYIPDKNSEKTPEWQKTHKYDRKLFGRLGSASGIEPGSLWPTDEELDKIIADENEWHPPLEVMLKNIAAREAEETKKLRDKEKLIAENMAKMPKMMEEWRRAKQEAKQKLREEKARKARLLDVARERFGHAVDPRSTQFLEMVAEVEKEEKKKRKLLKRTIREKAAAAAAAPVNPTAAAAGAAAAAAAAADPAAPS